MSRAIFVYPSTRRIAIAVFRRAAITCEGGPLRGPGAVLVERDVADPMSFLCLLN